VTSFTGVVDKAVDVAFGTNVDRSVVGGLLATGTFVAVSVASGGAVIAVH
jgi:hypothetical protein